ncbi:MAG: efflux RND transporter permease subunit, partial [Halodesulfurarchaeum sp.]
MLNAGSAEFRVFGTGIISEEFANVIFDSLIIVLPAAIILIVLFLLYAYRDPFDLGLALISLVMTVIWTLGFMGLANVPFTQMLTAVPPLLLAVGIDFGIHSINRYREERVTGKAILESMKLTVNQLLVAFFIVTGTAVIGFAANGTSSLEPIRDFGLIAAVGIVFTFFIFGVFLPAAKVLADQFRERWNIPHLGNKPVGQKGSPIGRALSGGVILAKKAPVAFLVIVIVFSALSAGYGAGVSTNFTQDDFLPPEETPGYLDNLPEPFAPNEYSVTSTMNFMEDNFATDAETSITMYVNGKLRADYALESIQRAGTNPPEAFVETDRVAQSDSIIGVIRSYSEQNSEFAALVARNDVDDDGVPDDNLETIYDELFASSYAGEARTYLTDDYRSAKVVYDIDSDATQAEAAADAKVLADRYRLPATATGQTVVFQDVSDIIFRSAATSLGVALFGAAVFLVLIYRLLEGNGTIGIVNLIPIIVTLTLIMGTMRALDIPFNAMTATVLAIAIGL